MSKTATITEEKIFADFEKLSKERKKRWQILSPISMLKRKLKRQRKFSKTKIF